MKYPGHKFLFEDDDDMDRSGQVPPVSSYSVLTAQLSNRPTYLTPKSSIGNYSFQQSRASTAASFFTCCGFTIDLSHKHSYSSSSRSTHDDILTRRPTMNKHSNHFPSKSLSPQSSTPSHDRSFKQQKSVCYRSSLTNRPGTRRRATTVIHCSHSTPVSTVTTLTNKPSTIHRSISNEKQCLPFEKLSPIIDINSTTTKDRYQANMNLNETSIILQTDCDELPLPASIIETC
jgi:hypothetical protein